VDFRNTQVFCLDDYLGKTRDDTASLTRWLYDVFLTPAAIGDEHIHRLPTTSAHPAEAADRYDKTIVESGGLDLAVIGIGPNGHIAFNEPGSAPNSRTRVVDLTEKSRNQSAEYWEGSAVIPEQAMTMGLGTILDARKLVLIASGSEKADMVRRALEEPPTLEVPGSWLQTAGSRLHVILDRDASRALRHS
jgi:glucosamine-6-phosphate deaminase